MRKVLISLAAAGAALAIATPAAAQYYPQYGQPAYGYGYGYNNRGQMQNQLQQIRYQANNLARQGRLTRSESRDLFRDIQSAERQLYRTRTPWASRELNQKIARIRYEMARYSDYDGRRGRYGYNGYNNGYYDRDRDGRDDRYEDDRGYRHD